MQSFIRKHIEIMYIRYHGTAYHEIYHGMSADIHKQLNQAVSGGDGIGKENHKQNAGNKKRN